MSGHLVSAQEWLKVARSVKCQFCGARAGDPCQTVNPLDKGPFTLRKGVRTGEHKYRISHANSVIQARIAARGDGR